MVAWWVGCCAEVEFWTVKFINSEVLNLVEIMNSAGSPILQYRSGITSTLLLLSAVYLFVELFPMLLIPRLTPGSTISDTSLSFA